MASPASYYFSDILPTSVCVDWPFAYVVGSKYGNPANNYSMECRKLRIDTYPITVVDSYTFWSTTSNIWGAFLSIRVQGNYVYLAGSYNTSTGTAHYHYTIAKLDKTNLNNVIWAVDIDPHYPATMSFGYDALPNAGDTIVVFAGQNDYGTAIKLNSSNGAVQQTNWNTNQYSQYGILGFYDSETYVDYCGTYAGWKQIFRYTVASMNSNPVGYPALLEYHATTGGELYGNSYYHAGRYMASLSFYQKSTHRTKQSDLSQTWSKYQDDVATNGVWEWNTCATVDGSYVYAIGFHCTSTTIPPYTGTLVKYDLDGNLQAGWPISLGANVFPPIPFIYNTRQLVNYGVYLITVEQNGLATGTGWLRLRNKSDGAIADLTPMGHFFPTYFQS